MSVRCPDCGTTVEVRGAGVCPICGASIRASVAPRGGDELELDEADVVQELDVLEEAPDPESEAGVWSDGRYLIMWKDAELPDVCVKSNQPANGGRLKRNLSWHHPAVYLALLANLIIYVILALVLRKTAVIEIGLSEEWFARRRRAIAIGWLSVVSGIGAMIAGIALVDRHDEFGWMILGGLLVTLFGAIYGLLKARMVAPIRITDEYVCLKGVHSDYLDALPQYTGPRF
jgi:hypothetical protein